MAKKKKTSKEKKRLFLITIVTLGLLVSLGASVYDSFNKIVSNRNEIATLKNEYESLLKENASLNSEVLKMQDPEYVARYAKENYYYSNDDEILIRIEDNNSNE